MHLSCYHNPEDEKRVAEMVSKEKYDGALKIINQDIALTQSLREKVKDLEALVESLQRRLRVQDKQNPPGVIAPGVVESPPSGLCVRCKKPGPHPSSHPAHCSACWNSPPPVGVTTKPIEVPKIEPVDPTSKRFSLIDME